MSFDSWSDGQRNKKKKSQRSTKELSFDEWSDNQVVNNVSTEYINAFITDTQSFFDNSEKIYNNMSWGNASQTFKDIKNKRTDLDTRSGIINRWLEKNKDTIDSETYNSLASTLKEINNSTSSIYNDFRERKKFYSSFETEDAFNSWYEEYTRLEEERKAILEAEDYDYYSQLGASVKNPENIEDVADSGLSIFGHRIFGQEGEKVGNVVTMSRDNADYIGVMEINGGDTAEYGLRSIYQYMTDEEVGIYNYYLAKEGEERANEYLSSLEDTLNQRQGGVWAENAQGNRVLEMTFAAGAGLEQFATGIRNLDNFIMGTEVDDTATATQYASSEIRGNLDGFWGAAYDTTSAVTNMLPSILVGTLAGPTAGQITFGASIAGNSYAEMKKLGYENWQAAGYSAMVTAFEVALQAALGGIGSLGGQYSLSSAITKLISKFDNAIARVAISVPLNMTSEGLEEAIQSILEPATKALWTGEDFEAPEWEEVFYSGLIGALSAGAIEGVPSVGGAIFDTIDANKYKNAYSGDGVAQSLVTEALEIDPNNEHAQRMQAKLDKGKDLSGSNIKHIVAENETAMYNQDVSSIKSATEERLRSLGETSNVEKLAEALTKQVIGENLTFSEKNLIKNSKYGQRVANELNTKNINSGEYSSAWAEKIGTNRINAEEYSRSLSDADIVAPNEDIQTHQSPYPTSETFVQQEKAAPTSENIPVKENATESEFKAVKSTPVSTEAESSITIEDASKKYGAQAQAMIHTYNAGQNVEQYDKAYKIAYDMGMSGVSLSYAMNSDSTSYLTEVQRELAYEAGRAASDTAAKEQDAKNKKAANGKTGRKIGTVKGEGVTISDLKKSFNDTQNTAYKILSTYAETTGIDIVLYKSEANADGKFEGSQGKFKWSEDTIYIDVNAGLANIKSVNDLAKYAMIRTFSHEFTHFLEKYNPIWYNELRKVVFDTLTERGENVNDLIEIKLSQDSSGKMTYEKASREVVAEAMTDILPDANFVEELATKHKNIFQKLLDQLKEFLSDLKAYFNSIGHNRSREANALKEQVGDAVHYVDNIVKLFDKVALEAVENYQATVATDANINDDTDGGITNGTEETGETLRTDRGTKSSISESQSGTREEIGDRSRVQSDVGGTSQKVGKAFIANRGIDGISDNSELPFKSSDIVTIDQNHTLWKQQQKLVNEYGIDCYVISESAWNLDAEAGAYKGKIYMVESYSGELIETFANHEANHVMKQLKYQPYLDFVDKVPELLDFASPDTEDLLTWVSGHCNIDFLSMNDTQRNNLYDEVNAAIYGFYNCDLWESEGYSEWIPDTFYDFNAYITELDAIHEQYKKEHGVKANNEVKTTESKNGYTVTDDANGRIITIKFEGKPSNDVRTILKNNAFVWNKTKGEWLRSGKWYNKNSSDDVIAALDGAYKAETQEVKSEEKVSKGVGEYSDNYNKLENAISRATRYEIGGFLFRIYKNGETWQGHLDQVIQSEGGYPIYDASGLHYKSEIFTNRQDAVDDLVAVARNNKLLGATEESVKPEKEKTATDILRDMGGKAVSENMTDVTDLFFPELAKKEATNNVENADNREPIQQPVSDRKEDTRVLDEVETADVSGDVQSGDSVGDSVERGQQTVRDDVRPDAAGTRRRSGVGDSESGDIRRDDELTPEAAEKLHEEVTEQIAQQSTELPKGKNFVIGDSLSLPNGEKARYKVNVAAIRLVKKLEAEGRYATEFEQSLLSKYVGWGGLANAFDEKKADWSKEYKELKELLTDEEYSLARGSTLNAHYTDISVIKAMYDGLKQLGFNGGRMLEPSSGVGNFVGAMPADMSAKVKSWTMVELDGITGLIAKYLYPNADVRIQGFETANIPNNYMDVAISNVPFGDYPITDKTYPKKITRAIHNYFFAKSLDKVRPGGILMFITSSYTMNSKDEAVRRYIMQRADLLGAIRLPNSAFKGNAGTEVVTDILILKKRAANTTYAGEDFLESSFKYISGYNGAYINSYFDAHPEMALGTASMDGSMYRSSSLTYKALEGKGSLADQIREAFKAIKGKMDYPAQATPEKTNFAVEKASKKTKQNGYVSKDGKIYQNKDGELVEHTVNEKVAERITGMLEIRDAARELQNYQQQGLNEAEIKKARQKLNKLYDAFVKKNGFLNAPANKSAFKEDPDCFTLFALENWDSDKKKATKADIFTKNTIAPNRTVTSAKDVSEGLIVSVNKTGGVDVSLIAKLTGKTEADVSRELIDSRKVFKNRNGVLETAETYLSGNVRAKLRDAEALVPIDSDYQKNVEALKSVMPEDVSYQDIFVNPGTPWIPSSVYSDFAAYMLGGRNTEWRQDIDVTRNPETGNFTVELKSGYLKHNASNTQKWGTPRRSFLDLFDAMLNSKSVVIKDKLDDGSFVINKDATAAANEKIENITKEFQEWLWKDEARRTELATLYNEVFNSIVTPKYNGDNLTVNGANAMKPLRPHQRNAVQRVISSGGNTLLAHKVGAGKTYEMAAAAMKLKELGLVQKPMFAVPKSLVAQWGNEFIDFFPTAKLLVAEATDFTPANRKIFMNRVANGNYDAVIVSYEQFEKLPMSDDFTRELYQEQINSIVAAIEEAKAEKGAKAMSVKDLEKKRKSLQAKIDKLTDKAKDEGNIDFEQLGVDSLFIDEAHNFKNLFYTTSMTNVAGLGNKDGSKRAFDLYTKVRYLQKLNGGKGIVFATATPVMNSMSEMYIMQKYLQPDLLEQLGLSTFDAWAKQFGEVVNGVEIKPSGQGYRVKQSFSRFKNMSELQLLFRNFADVLTDIPGLKIPKMKGGAVNVVVCEPGQFQQDYMKELEKRADNIKNVDPSVDNMLKITSDGRKISYTQRMIDPTLPYEEGCKIYRCADNVVKAYNDSNANKGTQLIFCDMATPKGKSKTEATETDDSGMDMESAKLYDDIKARLVQNGIPAKEIAFIHEADTDQKKKKLFADVNDGKVRVLIGSTGKMGVGMNAQKRVVAIHHLDAPWRPGDVEQRNGRAYRQGNINDEVECFTYVTEGSFDARLWDILERKQNFINQVMNGESVGRETEDTGEVTLSAAEVKALASGSPLIMEQVQLDTDIKKLESLQRAHRSSVANARQRLEADKGRIQTLTRWIDSGTTDMAAIVDTYSEGKFSITIGKQKFTEKKDAGVALMAAATAKAVDTAYTTIGSFAGFNVRVIKTSEGIKGLISGKNDYSFNTYPNNTTFMVNHLISVVESITEKVNTWGTQLEATKADMAEQEKLIGEPFAKQAELDSKRARYKEVMDILNPKEEQALDADDTVQEQSREYLNEDAVQEQQRTDTLTDHEVLAMAADQIKVSDLTEAEQNALGIFQERLTKLEQLQNERAEQGRLYKEQQFGVKPNRAEAQKTLNRMKVLDGQILKASNDVLSVEEKEVLKRVLKKARKVVEVQERQHGQEILNRWRDRRNNAAAIKKYRDRLRGDVDDLTNWILHPNNKDIVKHVPDVLKNSVIPFLSSINFMSKRALSGGAATKADEVFMSNLKKLNAAIKTNIEINGLYSGYNDLPPNFMENLQTFIDSTEELVKKNSGELVINQMTSAELKELSQVVRTLKKYITQVNRFHNNAMYQHVYEAGENSIEFLKDLGVASDKTGAVSNFVLWQQIRPAYAFERFGNGGIAIYDGLRRGQAKLAFNTQEIQRFTEKAYTEKEVKDWENEIKSFGLGKDLVKMPVSYIMAFYELSKDPEALEHINGEGIRVATYTHKGKKISDTGHVLTVGEFNRIINSLTDRQKEVADSLQKYMAEQGGKWGNYVSVARFGEEMFTNPKYFPINSDGRHLQSTADEHPSAASLYALLNMSFTKSRKEGANNRIVIYSIFDVFANHMASMAQYNAMALPILDALKWFNYQQVFIDDDGNKHIGDSVRERMDRAFGVPEETRPGRGKSGYAQDFVMNIIKAFNGTEAQGTPYDSLGLKSLHRYNVAQVAYNLRVVIQQPLAITRAAMLIDYGSIIKGMKLKPSAIKKNIEEMQKYSGIAAWKALGFYDVNISRGLSHIIKHDSSAMDKITDVGMWGAEKADLLTWAAIWSACKEEVIKKQLVTENNGYYEAVTKLFEDVIYKTQVVDSILTKNEFMRDKGTFARLVGSFMSEPTTNASMLIDAYDKYHLDVQRGMTKQQAWQKNNKMIGRRLYVYGVGAVLLAAVQAVADALRDDDEYEEWYEKWLEALGGNLIDELMPFNKLPIMSDFYDLAKEIASIFGADTYGNPPQSVFMQWYDSLIKGTEIIHDKIAGEDTNYTWYGGINKLLQAVSGMSGMPMASATREIITAWNNTVGAFAPSLKVKTYESSELAEIRYAYEDGYLTEEEAIAQILERGLADNEDEAYFIIQGWESGEGYSRYDKVYDAVRNGESISEAMDELTSHGYTEKEVLSKVKSQIGEWYQNGEISKAQATNMLTKYLVDMDSEEITATVNKWSSKVVTGIKYDDIDDEFINGNITASRAIEMYMRYGGMTREKATEKVTVLEFVKEHPYAEDISYSAINGYITYCEPYGVPVETFYDAWKRFSNTKADVDNNGNEISGSKKAKVLEYINSLNLSAAQKDSLYFAFGWAESKLYQAPWH